ELWSTSKSPTVPHTGDYPGVPTYFPQSGGSVLRLVDFPPASATHSVEMTAEVLADLDVTMPGGAIAHFEPDTPGMHTTDSVDYGIVLKGEIYLELDNGEERLVRAGDCVVQNGTRHAWHNRSDEVATMAFILIDATRT
ncbi:MAG: cupin domain-containing protein, partial [Kordiimonadaceae bacterium]|nr:cupin domain-containing protein [Kordiimonadaceae bacterium]